MHAGATRAKGRAVISVLVGLGLLVAACLAAFAVFWTSEQARVLDHWED